MKIVVLTGAGISAESGLKTFRDADGLWMGHKIEDVATPSAFRKDPERVLEFYNYRRREVLKAEPNAAHFGLAQLQHKYDVTIITQNIDDLHERAGSENVIHLHGEIFKMCSERNHSLIYPIKDDIRLGDLAEDGAQLRPFIVWFEEPVPMIETAMHIMPTADLFILVGTSLQVYPAAGLINFLQPGIPKYVIDKNIPVASRDMHCIEKPATGGISELIQLIG